MKRNSEAQPLYLQVYQILLAIIFPVSFWTLVFFFRELPSYLMRMPSWDILGVFAYSMFVSLLDSMLITAIVVFIAFVLPKRFFRDHLVAQGIVQSYLIILLAALVQLASTSNLLPELTRIPWFNLLFIGFFIGASISLNRLVIFSDNIQAKIHLFIERLTVLATIYLFLNLCAVLIVILRNFEASEW